MTEMALSFLFGSLAVISTLLLKNRYFGFAAQGRDLDFGGGPALDMRRHINGPMVCDGVIFGPTGRVSSTFTAQFNAIWRGNVCTMTEAFTYNDGSIQNRTWEISMTGAGAFTATAEDVSGKARGTVRGNAAIFRYDLTLPVSSGGHTLCAFDCMYLATGGTIVNRSEFRKFGFKVAELVATIRRVQVGTEIEDNTPLRRTG